MPDNEMTAATIVDIKHVRAELQLTCHEVGLALARRAGLSVLADVADDLTREAGLLRMMSKGRPMSGS